MSFNEFLFYCLLLAIHVITSAAGIGGGGIVIPIALSLYKFDTMTSIALSNCCMGSHGVVKIFKSLSDSHPLKNGKGTVHDYNFAAVAMPAAIIGISFGSIVNKVTPKPAILAFFVSVTFVTAY